MRSHLPLKCFHSFHSFLRKVSDVDIMRVRFFGQFKFHDSISMTELGFTRSQVRGIGLKEIRNFREL